MKHSTHLIYGRILKGMFILIFIMLCNIPIVSGLINCAIEGIDPLYGPIYHFQSGKNGFDTDTMSFNEIYTRERVFAEYKKQHPSDTILYRTFAINPLKFYLWLDYVRRPEYQYPYKKKGTVL